MAVCDCDPCFTLYLTELETSTHVMAVCDSDVTLVLHYILQNMRPLHVLWLCVFVTLSLLPTKLDGQLSEDDDDYIDPFDMMGETRPRGKGTTQNKVIPTTNSNLNFN